MKRGRKRQHNPNIPGHIDQSAIPRDVYFDHRGSAAGARSISTRQAGASARTCARLT